MGVESDTGLRGLIQLRPLWRLLRKEATLHLMTHDPPSSIKPAMAKELSLSYHIILTLSPFKALMTTLD